MSIERVRRSAVPLIALLGLISTLTACLPWEIADHLDSTWGSARFTPAARDVAYRPGSPSSLGDLYLPTGGTAQGVIIFIHGGGFRSGDRSHLWTFNGPLARQLTRGWAIFNITYRLAPADAFPAAAVDASAAVRWVRANGSRFGLRSDKVVLAGHSAGGTIAADAALVPGRSVTYGAMERVQGWVSVAGFLDLEHPLGNGAAARELWGAGSTASASPLYNLDANDPPGLVIGGSKDPIVPTVHIESAQRRAAAVGYRSLRVDVVPEWAPSACSGHAPMCGASVAGMDRFFDDVAAGRR